MKNKHLIILLSFLLLLSIIYIGYSLNKNIRLGNSLALNTSYEEGYIFGVNQTFNIIMSQLVKMGSNCETIPLSYGDGEQLNLVALECSEGVNNGN